MEVMAIESNCKASLAAAGIQLRVSQLILIQKHCLSEQANIGREL